MNSSLALSPFLAQPWQNRPHLEAPFSFGAWTYFSDGAIMIRIARDHTPKRTDRFDLNQKAEAYFETGENFPSVRVGRHYLNATYVRLLKTLPGLRLFESVTGDVDPLRFTFDGGEGILMPARP